MMNQIIYKERKNTNSMKWDNCGEKFGNEDLLPHSAMQSLIITDSLWKVPLSVRKMDM